MSQSARIPWRCTLGLNSGCPWGFSFPPPAHYRVPQAIIQPVFRFVPAQTCPPQRPMRPAHRWKACVTGMTNFRRPAPRLSWNPTQCKQHEGSAVTARRAAGLPQPLFPGLTAQATRRRMDMPRPCRMGRAKRNPSPDVRWPDDRLRSPLHRLVPKNRSTGFRPEERRS